MKGILYPTTPQHVNSILSREQVFHSIGKVMNDTQHPMPVYLYETKNSGGTGKIIHDPYGWRLPSETSQRKERG